MSAGRHNLVLIGIILLNLFQWSVPKILHPIPEDARLNFTEFGRKYGHPVHEFDVTTEDGYVLKLFHVPGDKARTVLLMHGIVDTADTFILRGKSSLALTLAQAGYDVWAGNTRGSAYAIKHSSLSPKVDRKYWDFSFHEMGYYDLPATIDFILTANNVSQLFAIGHSQGNSIFYVLASTRPEYNDKIKATIALGPIGFINHLRPPMSYLVKIAPILNKLLVLFNKEEILGQNSTLRRVIEHFCYKRYVGYEICARKVFFNAAGADAEELEPEFLPVVIGHYPKSTSRKNLVHLVQVATRNNFSQYDYGLQKNLEKYKSEKPPAYDLGKISMKVYLFAGKNDKLSPVKDVETLNQMLPNSEYILLERDKFNHVDHVWGKNMKKYLFPKIFKILDKYH